MKIETGYYLISDITGYTQFLTSSELDHATEILDSLFNSILENIQPPLVVASTRGDAIIAYVPDDAFGRPQALVDTMEQIYFDFRRMRDLVQMNTNCPCNACVNMNALDLKIFLHHGQYIVQQIGEGADLQGADVILAHRLMKNSVTEISGLVGYGLLTQTAVDTLDINGLTDDMIAHSEHYEYYGEVIVYIHDLHRAWEAEKARNRVFITPEDAVASSSVFVPVPQWVAWDYASDMETLRRYNDLETIERVDKPGGRNGVGAMYHCRHRLGEIDFLIVDWEPPDYFTIEHESPGRRFLATVQIQPAEGGIIFEVHTGVPQGPMSEEILAGSQQAGELIVARFAAIMAEEIATGHITPEQLEEAAESNQAHGRSTNSGGRFANLQPAPLLSGSVNQIP